MACEIMATLLVIGLLVGVDNLQVASGIGMMPVRTMRKWMIALAFGFCEAVMPLVGLVIGRLLHKSFGSISENIGPFILVVCGLCILYLALRENDASKVVNSHWVLFGLPLTLSLDNLFAGVGLGAIGYPILFSALVVGVLSGTMCLIGLCFGNWLRQWMPGNSEVICGAYLVVVGVIALLVDLD